MKLKSLLLLTFAIFALSCRPAAAPVSVSNRAVSVNGVRQPGQTSAPSKPIREMEWTTLDGSINTLADFQGKAVILDFWATYCGPCRQEIPHLNSLIAKHGAENLQVIGLNVGGDEDRPKIDGFAKETEIAYTIGFPEDALNRFIFSESDAIPQTAIFDRKGQLVQKFVGYSPAMNPQIDKAIETALSRN